MSLEIYNTELAPAYSREFQRPEAGLEKCLYGTFLEVCGPVEGLRILDVGCGGGMSSRLFAERGAFVTGFDVSLEQMEIARNIEKEHPLGITYLDSQPLENLGQVDANKFDLITSALVFHYATSREMLINMLRSSVVNMRDTGRVVALTANPDDPISKRESYPHKIDISWTYPDRAFQPYAPFTIGLYTSSGEPIPPFNNYHIPKEEWSEAISIAWKDSGFTPISKWHETGEGEQGNLSVFEIYQR